MSKLTDAKKAANKRWDAENITRISFGLPKELVERFRTECRMQGVSQAAIVRDAIEKFLGD